MHMNAKQPHIQHPKSNILKILHQGSVPADPQSTHIVTNNCSISPPLSQNALAGIVCCIYVQVRHMANQLIAPGVMSVPQRRPRQPFASSVLAPVMRKAISQSMQSNNQAISRSVKAFNQTNKLLVDQSNNQPNDQVIIISTKQSNNYSTD